MITQIFSLRFNWLLLPNNNINDILIHVSDCINNIKCCSYFYLIRSQCKALHALITKICLLLFKPCLIWIWEIQGPQNLGSVQKLSLLSRYWCCCFPFAFCFCFCSSSFSFTLFFKKMFFFFYNLVTYLFFIYLFSFSFYYYMYNHYF